ncbi:hypothetical protein O6P43_001857 [Quillaja saponaria]|uniref:Uncharacterized protein n=1 Tax=Quillaja saponaria TaxID=32244 RepID=A0AAD7QM44_QUISA|nr:hypothetical protein O6P43_001857 [Quillaja saponaria]
MSSEGDTASASPFDTSDGHPADSTITPLGEEPKYRLGKRKVLLPSLAYHPSTFSSSENTESGTSRMKTRPLLWLASRPNRTRMKNLTMMWRSSSLKLTSPL